MNIGWIGCGNMGRPMASNIIKGKHVVTIYDISEENMKSLIELGANVANSPAEVAASSDYIFTMLPNGAILKDVVLSEKNGVINGLSKDKTLVDMSTVAPAESETISSAIAEKCKAFLRAPVTGSTVLAEQSALGIFCSGNRDAYEDVLPIFKLLSTNQHYLGSGEEARVLKLAINLMIAINMQMLAEAIVLVDKAGLDRRQAMDIIAKSAAGSPVVNYKIGNVVNNDYTPAFSVAMMEKDLDLVLDAAKTYHLGLPLTALTRQFLGMIHSTNEESQDFAFLVRYLENISDIM